ncbi:hypothetical protein R5R35_009965 [Gryllus longicercus]|uniref:CIDE-N domain-containing protein n=1 Tax=Gryllus longicercus TaxID=2509291 RepID=A0AAN9V9W1_9ORTH
MRGYKVTDASRSKRVGVACQSLQELIEKGCRKLSIDHALQKKIVVQLEDGTVVDDEEYFTTLPQNTLLLFSLPGQDVLTVGGIIYDALQKINYDFLKAAEMSSEFFTEDMKNKFKALGEVLLKQKNTGKRYRSNVEDDSQWFEGLDTYAKTKEQFMFRRSQDRIRGYLYKSCDDLKKSEQYKSNHRFRAKIDSVIESFRKKLLGVQYFGTYFDRKAQKPQPKLCNEDGEFNCQGIWHKSTCSYVNHYINPYDSREARIIFSTWNLDHRIERSRTILPALLVAAEDALRRDSQINEDYFFSLLFTTVNLKLVHIVCHDKGSHDLSCDSSQFTK